MNQGYDPSQYIEGEINSEQDIIELACALANINRLFEIGELAFSSDELFIPGQLHLVKEALEAITEAETVEEGNKQTEALINLYKRLKLLNP